MADVQFIVDEIRKGKRLLIVTAVLFVAFAIGGAFIPIEAGAEAYVPFIKWGVLGAFVVLAILVFLQGIEPAEKAPIIRMLTETPDRIVWAHVLQRRTNGQHTATLLVVRTDAGKTLEGLIPMNQEGERRAMDLVAQVAPRAALGFRPEYEQQFARDPASLRRS